MNNSPKFFWIFADKTLKDSTSLKIKKKCFDVRQTENQN